MDSSQKEEGSSTEVENKRCCSVCKTTKTPLWRSGPSGPKSLCNACGIRFRKKRPNTTPSSPKNIHVKKGKIGKSRSMRIRDAFRVNLMMPLEKKMELMEDEQQRVPRQWGEVERAALLLMALSCGAVFA